MEQPVNYVVIDAQLSLCELWTMLKFDSCLSIVYCRIFNEKYVVFVFYVCTFKKYAKYFFLLSWTHLETSHQTNDCDITEKKNCRKKFIFFHLVDITVAICQIKHLFKRFNISQWKSPLKTFEILFYMTSIPRKKK